MTTLTTKSNEFLQPFIGATEISNDIYDRGALKHKYFDSIIRNLQHFPKT